MSPLSFLQIKHSLLFIYCLCLNLPSWVQSTYVSLWIFFHVFFFCLFVFWYLGLKLLGYSKSILGVGFLGSGRARRSSTALVTTNSCSVGHRSTLNPVPLLYSLQCFQGSLLKAAARPVSKTTLCKCHSHVLIHQLCEHVSDLILGTWCPQYQTGNDRGPTCSWQA